VLATALVTETCDVVGVADGFEPRDVPGTGLAAGFEAGDVIVGGGGFRVIDEGWFAANIVRICVNRANS
jgi:hypothetical protein